jgi:hypothetical protein
MKTIEEMIREKAGKDKPTQQLVQAVINEEMSRTKIAIGWILCETEECLEQNYIITLLKDRMKKLEKKLEENYEQGD